MIISVCGYLIWTSYTHEFICEEVKEQIVAETTITQEQEKYYVDVKGAVKKPGVYEVNKNNIINDVINLAGGFTKSAYTKNINLSKKISNELVIYIYTNSEYKKLFEK